MILGELKGVVSSSSALGRVKTHELVSISSSICSAALLDPEEEEEEEDAEELVISCSVVVISKGMGVGEKG